MITTPRLLLRPFVANDARKAFEMSREEGIARWIPDQVYRDEHHAWEVLRDLMAYTDQAPDPQKRPYVLGIERRGVLIGHVGLSPAFGSVEIGYAIEEAAQGRGFASEAVQAMVEWALLDVGLPEVLGITESDNVVSRRVLARAGFVWVREEVRHGRTLVIHRAARGVWKRSGAEPGRTRG